MREKLNLTTFNVYKNELNNLLKNSNKNLYIDLQNKLLSYDLSLIPFDEWSNLICFNPDFSETKANLDFGILNIKGTGIFKSCNIKNLEKARFNLNENFFDKKIVELYPNLFLSNIFDENIKNKYYNCSLLLNDLESLSSKHLEELEKKNIIKHLSYNYYNLLINLFSLSKLIDLYKYYHDDLNIIAYFLDSNSLHNKVYSNSEITLPSLIKEINSIEVSEVKNLCYKYARNNIIYNRNVPIPINSYPSKFILENDDIFLTKSKLSNEVKSRYYERNLTIDDIIQNIDEFINTNLEYFVTASNIKEFTKKLGSKGIKYFMDNHPDIFNHIKDDGDYYQFSNNVVESPNLENKICESVKKYFLNVYGIQALNKTYNANGDIIYSPPNWMKSLNLEVVEEFYDVEELKKYSSKTLLLDQEQSIVLDTFSLENILKFDNETKFFSHQVDQNGIKNLFVLGQFLSRIDHRNLPSKDEMTYLQFTDIMANYLNIMRKTGYFTFYSSYSFIEGSFRDNYPDIFISKNVPIELEEAFYYNNIDFDLLNKHKEYIPFLVDKNLSDVMKGFYDLNYYISPNKELKKINFLTYYSKLYGNENLLNFLSDYGNIGSFLQNGVIDLATDKKGLEKQYRKIVYNFLLNHPEVGYKHLKNVPDFVNEYSGIFLNTDDLNKLPESLRKDFEKDFYNRNIKYEDIRKNPNLVEILKEKNLEVLFSNYSQNYKNLEGTNYKIYKKTELELIKIIGKENFLNLCCKYGHYFENIYMDLNLVIKDNKLYEENKEIDFTKLCILIENKIADQCLNGKKLYSFNDAPTFLKNSYPELFIDENSPQELKDLFYCSNKKALSFKDLINNKEWQQFIKDKSISSALLKNKEYSYYDLKEYFDLFGLEKGLKYGIQNNTTVEHMISNHEVKLMKKWYDKTGKKFIPDFIVMEVFPLNEIDKFLSNGHNWSLLMKIKNFSCFPESREAMLKLAYSFGVFDGDNTGMKKILDLLIGIPREYKIEEIEKLKKYEQELLNYEKIIELNSNKTDIIPNDLIEYKLLKEILKKDGIILKSESIFDDLFDNNILKLNPQNHLEAMKYFRNILENNDIVLTSHEIHQLFGGFNLKYDKDFREFLLKNLDIIRSNREYTKYVSRIQKQFDSIKAFNSNRKLTLSLAISFVQSNKYIDVNIGNDNVAVISAIAGYSQEEFDVLQKIYNYGKIRTFSSIPRIENKTDNYTYEILRLDDPLALAIGTLTDCCQELGNYAETCMEHSMVDQNGRIFVIKDKENNIVAQSLVWRNKNVLCFDNIEIPDKAFIRANKISFNCKREFADEIYKIYKKASKELIKEDEKVYKELLDNDKITLDEYDGLRLGKITVGLGYNDIAESLKRNLKLEKETVMRPLPFNEPVKLTRALYTNDSKYQYILEERNNIKNYNVETLSVHHDNFIEYTDENFDNKMLLMLEKLELVTKNNTGYMSTRIEDDKAIVSKLSFNYNLNPKTTRIIMNPNFAIIYDVNDNVIRIGDLFYNFHIDNEQQQLDIKENVLLQIKLAINQITFNKNVDLSKLSKEGQLVYKKAISLDDLIDEKKGIKHGK